MANDIVIDNEKNIYVTGGFEQTAFFGNDSVVSSGNRDIFIAKYDSLGTLQWIKKAGGKRYNNPVELKFDKENNLLLAGNFQDTCYFEGQRLIAESFTNVFTAKYSPDGNLIQVEKANIDIGESMLFISQTGNTDFFLSGTYRDTMIIGNDTLTAQDGKDIFIARFDNNFQYKSVLNLSGFGKTDLKDIKYFNNNFFILLNFTDSIDIGVNRFWSYGNSDVLLLKADSLFTNFSVKQFAGFGTDGAESVIVNSDSSLYAGIEFESKLYFDEDSVISKGGKDILLIKTDNNLNTLWYKQIGSATNDYVTGLLTNTVNTLYLSGSFSDTLKIENKTIISKNGTEDMFLAKYSPEGENIGLKQAGGSGNEFNNLIINDPDNYLYIIGNFDYNFAFEIDSISSDSIFGENSNDIFIARFFDCDYARYPDIGNDTSFCGYGTLHVLNDEGNNSGIFSRYKKYRWNNGRNGKYLNVYDSGFYSVTTVDNHKCLVTSDSIFVAVYPLPEPDLGEDIHAQPEEIIELIGGSFETYLWSNDSTTRSISVNTADLPDYSNNFNLKVTNIFGCEGEDDINIYVEGAGYSPGSGNNRNYDNQVYSENNSSYGTLISKNNNNNSGIIKDITGINNKEIVSTSALVYPNPNNGHFYVNMNTIKEKNIKLVIYSEEGRKVYEQNTPDYENIEINISSKGVHYIIIETENNLFFEKIIINSN